MVVDPRELRPRKPAAPANDSVIKVDSPCPRCGANLRGLARWAACPDCGAPVDAAAQAAGLTAPQAPAKKPPRARVLVHVKDLPRKTKWRLAFGTRIAATGLVAFSGTMGVLWLLLTVRSQGWLPGFSFSGLEQLIGWCTTVIVIPGVIAWGLGLWMIIPDVPPKPKTKEEAQATASTLGGLMVDKPAWWPWVARLAPFAWLPAMGALAASIAAGGINSANGGSMWGLTLGLTFMACCAHLAPCVFLRELALVVHDDLCATRCLHTALLLPVLFAFTSLILAPNDLFSHNLGDLTMITGGFQGLFLVIAFLGFVLWPTWRFVAGVWSLADSCSWSVLNDFGAESKEQRFIAQSLEIERQANEDRKRLGELD